MRFELVIFDCDGVLVDSEMLTCEILAQAIADEGLPFSAGEAFRRFTGGSMQEVISFVETRLGRELPEDFEERFRERSFRAYEERLLPVSGIEQVLDVIDIPSCVASSGPPEKIAKTLGLTGLRSRFLGKIFSAYELDCFKPDPGLFLHAARTMGVNPAHTAVVEDSSKGVQAGVAAGMKVFGYAERADPEVLERHGARVFHDMRELPELLSGY